MKETVSVLGAHKLSMLSLRCTECLTDLQYMARHPNVPCLPDKMRRRNERRIAVQRYREKEKDDRVRAYGELLSLARQYIDTMNAKYGKGNWAWPAT